jgi:LacI family transcriptional regulator
MITQKQIARQLGVSQSAVAFAFHPTLHAHLSQDKRQHILTTAQRLGYQPHHAARRLIRTRFRRSTDQFDQVGLIFLAREDERVDPVCLAMMCEAEHEFSRLQASLTFVNVSVPGGWSKVDRLTQTSGVDGWLVYGPVDDAIVGRLRRNRLPFVILGDHRCTQPVNCVRLDNAAAGRMVAQHVAKLGHRRVAYLRGAISRGYIYQRETLDGFRAAARELGLDTGERWIGEAPLWVGDEGRPQVVSWLRQFDPMPTAAFVSEFDMAGTVFRLLRASDIAVPGDISLVAYELPSLATTNQNFSRVELPMSEVGRQGALLLHQIATQPKQAAQEVTVAPRWAEGETTGPPRAHAS